MNPERNLLGVPDQQQVVGHDVRVDRAGPLPVSAYERLLGLAAAKTIRIRELGIEVLGAGANLTLPALEQVTWGGRHGRIQHRRRRGRPTPLGRRSAASIPCRGAYRRSVARPCRARSSSLLGSSSAPRRAMAARSCLVKPGGTVIAGDRVNAVDRDRGVGSLVHESPPICGKHRPPISYSTSPLKCVRRSTLWRQTALDPRDGTPRKIMRSPGEELHDRETPSLGIS